MVGGNPLHDVYGFRNWNRKRYMDYTYSVSEFMHSCESRRSTLRGIYQNWHTWPVYGIPCMFDSGILHNCWSVAHSYTYTFYPLMNINLQALITSQWLPVKRETLVETCLKPSTASSIAYPHFSCSALFASASSFHTTTPTCSTPSPTHTLEPAPRRMSSPCSISTYLSCRTS